MAVDAHSRHCDPAALRAGARSESFTGITAAHCRGAAQANLAVLPGSLLTHAPGLVLVLDLPNERLRS